MFWKVEEVVYKWIGGIFVDYYQLRRSSQDVLVGVVRTDDSWSGAVIFPVGRDKSQSAWLTRHNRLADLLPSAIRRCFGVKSRVGTAVGKEVYLAFGERHSGGATV